MRSLIVFLLVVVATLTAQARLCQEWGAVEEWGGLDTRLLPEASGLAISAQYSGRLYHINDSGNQPIVVMTDRTGRTQGQFRLKDMKFVDTEEMALGPCGKVTCLYIGDIGDNRADRDSVEIAWLPEKKQFAAAESILGLKRLYYPDRPHNAEAMVVIPNGDLFIFTKGIGKGAKKVAEPSYVFRLSAEDLHSAAASATLEKVAEIDLPKILKGYDPIDQVVTGASVSSDGKTVLLLSYRHVLELEWDFQSPLRLRKGKGGNYRLLDFDYLRQQEAISYWPGTPDFIVTTESDGQDVAPILHTTCLL